MRFVRYRTQTPNLSFVRHAYLLNGIYDMGFTKTLKIQDSRERSTSERTVSETHELSHKRRPQI